MQKQSSFYGANGRRGSLPVEYISLSYMRWSPPPPTPSLIQVHPSLFDNFEDQQRWHNMKKDCKDDLIISWHWIENRRFPPNEKKCGEKRRIPPAHSNSIVDGKNKNYIGENLNVEIQQKSSQNCKSAQWILMVFFTIRSSNSTPKVFLCVKFSN